VKYGEMGFVDPTHIKLKDSVDANRSSTKYEWEGYDVGLKSSSLDMTTEIIEQLGTWTPLLEIDASFLKDKVGFGSYNAIIIELTNPHGYYVPTELSLSRSEGIRSADEYNRYVLLGPQETKKEFWIIQLESGQDLSYVYNFTTAAYTTRNASDTAYLASTRQYKVYSLDEIRNLIDDQTEEVKKTYSESVTIDCSADSVYYQNQVAEIYCIIQNTGNVNLDDLSICLDRCEDIDLTIGASGSVTFERNLNTKGPQDLVITAKNSQVTKSESVQFEVWDRPDIQIDQISYPSLVDLSDKFTIEFTIHPKTDSVPQDVRVELSSNSFQKDWALDELVANRKYILNVDEYSLTEQSNDFKIFITYSDQMGRKFSNKEEFNIRLKDMTVKQRLILLVNRLNVELTTDMIIIGLAVFFALVVIRFIFKKRD